MLKNLKNMFESVKKNNILSKINLKLIRLNVINKRFKSNLILA